MGGIEIFGQSDETMRNKKLGKFAGKNTKP